MASNVYTADGGATVPPVDQKTNSLFGGGILGGLGLTEYYNDWNLSKTFGSGANEYYSADPWYTEINTKENNGWIVLVAIGLGVLLIIKSIFD